MSSLKNRGLFEAFNARNLTPVQVAQRFVPPPHFARLVQHGNSLMVGPRGSGKTTLLKMLQQEAIESWEHEDAETLLGGIEYSTAYVPTDYRWSRQLQHLGMGKLSDEHLEMFAMAAYTTHAVRALCAAMIGRLSADHMARRTHRRVQLSPRQEEDLTRELGSLWGIDPAILSMVSLRQALSRRLQTVRWEANRIAGSSVDAHAELISGLPFVGMPLLESLAAGAELFNDFAGEAGGQWALAFDELELAPRTALRELLSSLRTADHILLLKLALAPASPESAQLEAEFAAAPDQDYKPIRLWYPDRAEGEAFCQVLWQQLSARRGLPDLTPEEVLGLSYFEPIPGPNGDDYEPGSKWAKQFATLAKKDGSFGAYLKSKKLVPSELHLVRRGKKESSIRKVAPLLPLRDFYRGDDGRMRSRKTVSLYKGAKSLFAISEGNPRWFIGLVTRVLDLYEGKQLTGGAQARELKKTSERFAAYLRTLPAPIIVHRGAPKGVLGVVATVARRIHEEHVKGEFQPEPPATFRIPARIDQHLSAIFAVALNAGAIVLIPDDEGPLVMSDLRGKRFRLSYLLAPLYGLPLRLGRPLSLDSVFSRRSMKDPRNLAPSPRTSQEELELGPNK